MSSKQQNTRNAGFSLIELMVILAVIGILAVIAIPNYLNYQCISKTAEAKSLLGTILLCEDAYNTEYDSYSSSLDRIGFGTKAEIRYSYSVVATETTFVATAISVDLSGTNDDAWIIDEHGNLQHISIACK